MEEIKKVFIECECGAHLLQVTSEVEIFDSSNSETDKPRVRQEFDFAMFSYGKYNKKLNLWERIKVAWNFLRTCKMHEDQIILSPNEAQKLVNFINENIVTAEKE